MLGIFIQEARGKAKVYQVDLMRVLIPNQDVIQLQVVMDEAQLVQGTKTCD